MWLGLAILACGGGPCPQGEIRDGSAGGDCVPYEADDPVPSGDAWRPAPGTSWQWQLSGTIDASYDVDMYDVDLFDAPDSTLDELRGDGRILVCYFSAGSYEDWRPDADDFPDDAIGEPLEGWEGEWWLDVNHSGVRAVMEARLDRAADRGCDGVEPDNVDGHENESEFGITATEQLAYNRFLADEAHSRGLSVGLKNDVGQLEDLRDWFDWALNEECVAYDECGAYADWTGSGSAVFHVEYVDRWAEAEALADEVCTVGPDLDTIIKTWDLGSERLACE